MTKTWTIINAIRCISGEVIYEVRHVSNGLKLLYIKRKDDNRISFSLNIKTPVYSNKGTSHVVEHCVGNDILSDPITWNYIESTICKYNFYTLLDRTVYECNSKDKDVFEFLLKRTIQCVYNPSIYDRSNIFYSEACREESDCNGNRQFNGIVFNEMKQALSGPESLLNRVIPFSLGISGFISGGTPAGISKLTFEEALNYHKKYYQFCNSYLVISGNNDLEIFLDIIEKIIHELDVSIEKKCLDFEVEKSGLGMGEKLIKWRGLSAVEIPLCNLGKRYMFSVNFLLNELDTMQKYLMYINLKNTVFKNTLKEYKGLGKVILNTGIKHPYIGLALVLCKEKEISTFYNAITKILSNKDNKYLFERNYFSRNPECSVEVWERWLSEVFIYDMDVTKFVDSIGMDIGRSLNDTMLLQGKSSVVIIKPEENITPKNITKIMFDGSSKPLKKQKEHTTIMMHNMVNSDNKNIIKQAKRIWTDEITEINYKNKTLRVYPNEKHDGFTYLYFYYDVGSLVGKNSDILELHLSTKVMLHNATESEEYRCITDKGGIVNAHIIGCEDNYDSNDVKVKLLIVGKIQNGNEIKLLKFIKNMILCQNNIENVALDIINMCYRTFEMQLYSNPDILLRRRFKASCTQAGIVEEVTSGIFMYETICDSKIDKQIDFVYNKINCLFDLFSFPAQLSVYSDLKIENEIMSFIKESDCCRTSCTTLNTLKLSKKTEGFVIPFPNQYIAGGGNYKRLGHNNVGLAVLFSYIINIEYFRKRIRLETGAYSSSMRHYSDGTLLFESINDPGLEVFTKRIEELPDFLHTLKFSSKNMYGVKKEAVQRYLVDFVLNNSCDNRTIKYLKNVTWEYVEGQITAIMDATDKDYDSFISQIECILTQNCFCIMGNEETLNRKKDFFSVIRKLPIEII